MLVWDRMEGIIKVHMNVQSLDGETLGTMGHVAQSRHPTKADTTTLLGQAQDSRSSVSFVLSTCHVFALCFPRSFVTSQKSHLLAHLSYFLVYFIIHYTIAF